MSVKNTMAAWLLCATFSTLVAAQEPEAVAESAPETAAGEAVDEAAVPDMKFQYRTGDVVLPNNVATLRLGDKYRYLDPKETNRLLMAWGNPSNDGTQGAIIPRDVEPMSRDGWAVILNYVADGYIDDSDAGDIDYDDLLSDMQKGTEESNEYYRANNFPTVKLLGWAEKPHYDSTTKKLYWAKELQFSDTPVRTLNYDVRVLGREGVLSMNAVSTMNQLAQIKTDMRPLIQVAEFNQGYRYADFNESTDKVAAYGLGALIAGGVAAKLGLFAKLAPFLKFIVFGVIAVGGFLFNLFRRKKDAAT